MNTTTLLLTSLILSFGSATVLAEQSDSPQNPLLSAKALCLRTGHIHDFPALSGPPGDWKGVEESEMMLTGFTNLGEAVGSASLVQVTMQNTGAAPINITLRSLSDAKLYTRQTGPPTPAVAMYWRIKRLDAWITILATEWKNPITLILPAKGIAELQFVFPSTVPGITVSLPSIGNVKVAGTPAAGTGGLSANRQNAGTPVVPKATSARAAQYVDNGDGTVTDKATGLMWAASDNGGPMDWYTAQQYCATYRGGGHSDWRMPTIPELRSLFDSSVSGHSGCHLTPLITLTSCAPWSSETVDSSSALYFEFEGSDGAQKPRERRHDFFFRALPVRSAKD